MRGQLVTVRACDARARFQMLLLAPVSPPRGIARLRARPISADAYQQHPSYMPELEEGDRRRPRRVGLGRMRRSPAPPPFHALLINGSELFADRERRVPIRWSTASKIMEPLRSPLVARGGKAIAQPLREQPLNKRKSLPPLASSCRQERHGKEGVDGSSPSEGSAKTPHVGVFAFRPTCRISSVRWVWSRLWSFRVENAGR